MKTQKQPRRILAAVAVSFVVAAVLWLFSRDLRGDWLRYSVSYNHPNRAKVLVWLGTDVNYSTEDGTALHVAAANGNIAMIQFLLQHGAHVNSEASFNVTPLWEARFYRHTEAERVLLAHGANPDTSHIHVP